MFLTNIVRKPATILHSLEQNILMSYRSCYHSSDISYFYDVLCLQIATVEVPEEHMGPVVELLGKRRGQMFDMQGLGYVILCYSSLTNLLLNKFQSKCKNRIKGTELVHYIYLEHNCLL